MTELMESHEAIAAILALLIAMVAFAYVENRHTHTRLFEKMDRDHKSLMQVLLSVVKELGGKADK